MHTTKKCLLIGLAVCCSSAFAESICTLKVVNNCPKYSLSVSAIDRNGISQNGIDSIESGTYKDVTLPCDNAYSLNVSTTGYGNGKTKIAFSKQTTSSVINYPSQFGDATCEIGK